ncbi:hypothetical protein Bca52824_062768 [Brassica carinata]|uniref:Rubisco LSMT substrate-binding domain-containing protein n=1 Tax=Brassica carinata TaxID=52824 RepID=A0A8X7QET6_BRACI|nr:hypothetical protein Bca52824_062768 [Brassica carinata]
MGVKEYCNTSLLLSRERRATNQKDTFLGEVISKFRSFFCWTGASHPATIEITLMTSSWHFGILRSRAFSRLRGQNLVLIPLADLINHNPAITTEDSAYRIKGGGLFSRDLFFSLEIPRLVTMLSRRIQYDLNKSNADLAPDHGFSLTIEIPESDPFLGDKLDIAYIRLVALCGSDAFLLESIFRNTIWGHLELPVTRSNEELICRVVRDACKFVISGFTTTIEKDRQLEHDVLEYYQERRLKDLCLVGGQGEIIFWE